MKLARALNWKYAIGELLIVVVGILLAVQIDRWNSALERSEVADAYLGRLAEDLQADTEILNSNSDLARRWSENTDLLLFWLGEPGDPPPPDSLAETINGSRGGLLRPLQIATYRDLISGGNLSLIEDLELRDAIVSYYEVVPAHVATIIASADSRTAPLYPLMGRHIDERVLYGKEEQQRDLPLFVTSWSGFAGDGDIALHLRQWSASAHNTSSFFVFLAEQAEALRVRVSEARDES
jgi:hypothetical protein